MIVSGAQQGDSAIHIHGDTDNSESLEFNSCSILNMKMCGYYKICINTKQHY